MILFFVKKGGGDFYLDKFKGSNYDYRIWCTGELVLII